MTRVVHVREKFDVYIGRPSVYGNPFSVAEYGRVGAMSLFRTYFRMRIEQDEEFRKAVEGLRGKTLGCWCKNPNRDRECHGDVYVEYLEGNGRLF